MKFYNFLTITLIVFVLSNCSNKELYFENNELIYKGAAYKELDYRLHESQIEMSGIKKKVGSYFNNISLSFKPIYESSDDENNDFLFVQILSTKPLIYIKENIDSPCFDNIQISYVEFDSKKSYFYEPINISCLYDATQKYYIDNFYKYVTLNVDIHSINYPAIYIMQHILIDSTFAFYFEIDSQEYYLIKEEYQKKFKEIIE